MAAKRAGSVGLVGPGRWGFRAYHIIERMAPRGRRFEVRTPAKQRVAVARTRRGSDELFFYADEEESVELVRFVPKALKRYAAAFDVMDAQGGRRIGEFRKKVYAPLNKWEWFIFDDDGEALGMVTAAVPSTSFVSRFLSIAQLQPKVFELHWGQTVGGRIECHRALWGLDRAQLDLSLDTRDAIDRRLALGVAVLVRSHDAKSDATPEADGS